MNILNWILLFSLAVTLIIIFKMWRSILNTYFETGFLCRHNVINVEVDHVDYRVSYLVPVRVEREGFTAAVQHRVIQGLMANDKTGTSQSFLSVLAAYQTVLIEISPQNGQPR